MKKLLVLMMVLLAVPFAQAAFSSVFTPIDNEILPNETATFELAISNFDNMEQRFQVYTIDPNWVMRVDPVRVVVDSQTSESFTISLKPKSTVPFGSQGVTLNVKDLESGDIIRKTLFVAVKNAIGTQGRYQPSVNFVVGLPQTIDPREPVGFDVNLRNRNALDIDDMTLTLRSPHYEYETTLDLGPLAEQTESLTMQLPAQTEPGVYELVGELHYREALVTRTTRQYTIGEFATINKDQDEQALFLKNIQTITLSNNGNVEKEATARLPANIIQRLLSSQTPDADYQNGQYVWTIDVPPGESVTVILSKNYRWVSAIILLALIGVIAYYVFRSPVVAAKEAVNVKKGEGVSTIKYRIFIRNRSNAVIQGVEVYDKVSKMADLKETHVMGTLKPNKVTKTKSGALLHWNLDILEPYEERILTYTVECKLQIVGKMKTPQAKIKFETGKGQERTVYSENLIVEN